MTDPFPNAWWAEEPRFSVWASTAQALGKTSAERLEKAWAAFYGKHRSENFFKDLESFRKALTSTDALEGCLEAAWNDYLSKNPGNSSADILLLIPLIPGLKARLISLLSETELSDTKARFVRRALKETQDTSDPTEKLQRLFTSKVYVVMNDYQPQPNLETEAFTHLLIALTEHKEIMTLFFLAARVLDLCKKYRKNLKLQQEIAVTYTKLHEKYNWEKTYGALAIYFHFRVLVSVSFEIIAAGQLDLLGSLPQHILWQLDILETAWQQNQNFLNEENGISQSCLQFLKISSFLSADKKPDFDGARRYFSQFNHAENTPLSNQSCRASL